jgi:hypothetical protein
MTTEPSGAWNWIKKYVVVGILLAAVVGVAKGWVDGVIRPWVPAPDEASCWIRETWKRYATGPLPRHPNLFTVLVARLNGDADGSQTQFILDAFLNQSGFRPLKTCRAVAIVGDDRIAAQQAAIANAEALLAERGGDLVIWGQVVRAGSLRIWFIPTPVDQNSCAQSRRPMEMMRHGCSTRLLQWLQQCMTASS